MSPYKQLSTRPNSTLVAYSSTAYFQKDRMECHVGTTLWYGSAQRRVFLWRRHQYTQLCPQLLVIELLFFHLSLKADLGPSLRYAPQPGG